MRIELCRRLVSEMRVQVLSIDSARQNVDIHFNYICKAYADFSHNYARQFATVRARYDHAWQTLAHDSAPA